MKNDFQPVVGHRFSFRSTPVPNWNGVIDCEVLVVEPNSRLSYSWGAHGFGERCHLDIDADRRRHASPHGAIRFPVGRRRQLQGREIRMAEVSSANWSKWLGGWTDHENKIHYSIGRRPDS